MRTKARDEAEALSERHEDVRDRGQELGARVEAVLSKLQVYHVMLNNPFNHIFPGQNSPVIRQGARHVAGGVQPRQEGAGAGGRGQAAA